jgi:hypothetical protein
MGLEGKELMRVSGKVFSREKIRYLDLVSSGGARIELLSQKM